MTAVLTTQAELLNDLYQASAFYDNPEIVACTLRKIREHASWVARECAENDTTLRQLVACAVVTRGHRVLCVRRSKKTNRPALRLRYSLMIGGHVDENDADAPDMLDHCVRRELREEFGLEPLAKPRLLGLVVDAEHSVGVQHVGVVYAVMIDENTDAAQQGGDDEFVYGSRRRIVDPVAWSDVLALANRLDPWSLLFVASRSFAAMVGRKQFDSTAAQWVLPFTDPLLPPKVRIE